MEKWFYDNVLKIAMVISMPLVFAFIAQELKASDQNGERYCMAQNIYFEAANQSFAGKLAVAHVVINRTEDLQFPNEICDVIYQAKTKVNWKGNEVPIRNQCQFSWYCDGLSDEPVDSVTWIKSLRIADLVLTGEYKDITEGALWYHADYIYPYWADELEEVTQIDNHRFYK
tara:strand:- start:113 stop:628 length:516 start_codon:yes stop_codon:yes gene_type:complete